jgi:hypothetical protein
MGLRPWRDNGATDFDAAAGLCEIRVTLNADDYNVIKDYLYFDKRPHGNRGLCLRRGYEPLGLLTGDRVEATPSLPDPVGVFNLTSFPCDLVFWRSSRNSSVLHRCPLWSEEIGLVPSEVVAIDLLHAYYLGPLLVWAKTAMWKIIDSGHLGGPIGTRGEKQLNSVYALNGQLRLFYKKHRLEAPDDSLTEVTMITPKMFGIGLPRRRLKLKAAEA